MNIQSRIQDLTATLNKANIDYYIHHAPTITDREYDTLFHELLTLEQAHPYLRQPDSPTLRVPSDLQSGFAKVTHHTPMLSLSNTYNEKELTDWYDSLVSALHISPSMLKMFPLYLSAELKYDGLSASLIYTHGRLTQAVTRGDGTTGDDVTANVRMIQNVPLYVEDFEQYDRYEIRGEILMGYASFNALNKARIKAGEEPFANPRNAASGTLRSFDSRTVRERGLMFYAYDCPSEMDNPQDHIVSHLGTLGFDTHESKVIFNTKQLSATINHFASIRSSLPFPIDGIVFKVNNKSKWRDLGITARVPRYAIAYKFPTDQFRSRLLSVEWQVAESGRVTPVAHYEPISMYGTTCRRATLNNPQWIENNLPGLRIGDTLILTKGAEIIPKITGFEPSAVRSGSDTLVTPPTHCPLCGTPLIQKGAYLTCPNTHFKPTSSKPSAPAPSASPSSVTSPSSASLSGKVIVVSGSFATPQRRRELESLVTIHGGVLGSGVTKNTTYLLAGQNVGPSKLIKAQSLGIPVIDESTFLTMLPS